MRRVYAPPGRHQTARRRRCGGRLSDRGRTTARAARGGAGRYRLEARCAPAARPAEALRAADRARGCDTEDALDAHRAPRCQRSSGGATVTTTDTVSAAADLLDRLGVDPALVTSGDLVVRTPITGEEIGRVSRTDEAATDAAIARSRRRVRRVARRAGAASRRARPAARRGAAPREGRARRARHARGREDRAGGSRRGAGDDRHLRLRRRPLAAALRPLDRLGAPGAPAHRDVAPARPRGRHERVQLPRRGVELERRARARLRRSGDLEAVREDAAHGDRDDGAARAGRRAVRRRPGRPLRARDRRCRPRGAARRRRAHPARLRHRLDADGQGARTPRRRPARPLPARARRQQRRDRRAERRPRAGRARRPLLGRRHGGAALHQPAPADRPRVDRR